MNWKVLRELLMAVIGLGLILFLNNLNADIDRNYQTNLQSRAEDCRLELGLGITLSNGCLTPEMRKHFNPNEKIQTGSMRVLCEALQKRDPDGQLPQGCPDA